ncbi:hypothetical protein PIB30_073705, partial [Stylosanthes scabra]|nr:hypothetical protein [Stylosanthes scabra]
SNVRDLDPRLGVVSGESPRLGMVEAVLGFTLGVLILGAWLVDRSACSGHLTWSSSRVVAPSDDSERFS